MLGLEDPRDRGGGSPGTTATNATGNYPDIVLAVTGGIGGFNLRGAVAVTDRTSGTGWAANLAATAKLGVVDLKGTVAYSDNAKSYTGGNNCAPTFSTGTWVGCDDGQWWSALPVGRRRAWHELQAGWHDQLPGRHRWSGEHHGWHDFGLAQRVSTTTRRPVRRSARNCSTPIRKAATCRLRWSPSLQDPLQLIRPKGSGSCPAERSAGHFLWWPQVRSLYCPPLCALPKPGFPRMMRASAPGHAHRFVAFPRSIGSGGA